MPAQKNKLAIGLEESPSSLEWSDDYFDVPGLDCSSTWKAIADWQGENNTRVVLRYCKANGKSCPAFEYVIVIRQREHKPEIGICLLGENYMPYTVIKMC